jgi:hypothetical protein
MDGPMLEDTEAQGEERTQMLGHVRGFLDPRYMSM